MSSKSAVLVIDMQAKIFDPDPKPFEADDVIKNINNITSLARKSAIPVFFIQHEVPGYLDFQSDGWQLQKDLIVDDSDLRIRKAAGDAFLNSELEQHLKSLGITNLVICGYASEFCIDSTTRRAVGLGYKVELVTDAHTTHDKAHLSAEQIRQHHNVTLSMGQTVTAVESEAVNFDH